MWSCCSVKSKLSKTVCCVYLYATTRNTSTHSPGIVEVAGRHSWRILVRLHNAVQDVGDRARTSFVRLWKRHNLMTSLKRVRKQGPTKSLNKSIKKAHLNKDQFLLLRVLAVAESLFHSRDTVRDTTTTSTTISIVTVVAVGNLWQANGRTDLTV